jgi:hypothetical protein
VDSRGAGHHRLDRGHGTTVGRAPRRDLELAADEQRGRTLNDGIDSLEEQLRKVRAGVDVGPRARTPRQVFEDQIYGCFIRDDHGARCLEEIGIDKVMLETDYPHSSTEFPDSLARAQSAIGHLSAAAQEKILRSNASRLFDFVPAAPPSRQ